MQEKSWAFEWRDTKKDLPRMKNKERYSRIPVGIIGCGNISKIYALAGRKFEGIELVACADIDVSRARALAEEESIPRALDVGRMLADPGIVLIQKGWRAAL